VTRACDQPWRADRAGVRLLVRVTPRAGRDEIDGLAETAHGPAVAVRVRAAADKGDANRAVEAVVADWLGIAKSVVAVASGGKSRVKTLLIAGEPATLKLLMEARLGALS
jgi:uncharacterized protein